MKRELGIACCGLACCLCSENRLCGGCNSGACPGAKDCENKQCAAKKGLSHCYQCSTLDCRKGLLGKIKPYTFTQFCKEYGEAKLLDSLEKREKQGVVYHRAGINGDYDDFTDVEQLTRFLLTGNR